MGLAGGAVRRDAHLLSSCGVTHRSCMRKLLRCRVTDVCCVECVQIPPSSPSCSTMDLEGHRCEPEIYSHAPRQAHWRWSDELANSPFRPVAGDGRDRGRVASSAAIGAFATSLPAVIPLGHARAESTSNRNNGVKTMSTITTNDGAEIFLQRLGTRPTYCLPPWLAAQFR